MHRIIEKNKTYRIVDRKKSKTSLFHVDEIHERFLLLKDLATKQIKKFDRKDFEKKLDEGKIYVSAYLIDFY